MSTDLGTDFFEKFNAIENKLRKRFMRKPNVSEATEEFSKLAVQCELAEQPSYAGSCYLESAKCEGSIGNTAGEAEYLLLAARQFMKAELKINALKCISPGRENLELAINCYIQACTKYPDKSPLRACVYMELASQMETLEKYDEAIFYYQHAVDNYENNYKGHTLNCLTKIASTYLKQEKYTEALETYKNILEIATEHSYAFHIERCDVNILLLYLICQPSPKTLPESVAKIIEKYSLDNDEDHYVKQDATVHPELHLHLQSIMYSCKMNDVKSLISLVTEVKNYLTIEQMDLMNALVSIYQSLL